MAWTSRDAWYVSSRKKLTLERHWNFNAKYCREIALFLINIKPIEAEIHFEMKRHKNFCRGLKISLENLIQTNKRTNKPM